MSELLHDQFGLTHGAMTKYGVVILRSHFACRGSALRDIRHSFPNVALSPTDLIKRYSVLYLSYSSKYFLYIFAWVCVNQVIAPTTCLEIRADQQKKKKKKEIQRNVEN
jgi:hypothetical protein